jgi:propionyl-CoA carboxylase alpha chain
MFQKILIANRGEIACRIIKTARKMGIRTVAVYSEADVDALHVEMADEAVCVGPAAAALSYLNIENILAACRTSKAEAVHPGYGFLSERESFALALQAENIAFIGPNPAAIAAMGDKIESKKRAQAAGVSTVPGNLGLIENADEAVKVAQSIGFPVMIKASAGGGGKGMRIAYTMEEAREGFARARSEAASSFGDDRIFIEKFIVNPRHIEIQVLGDKHGNIIHLGERECSIQRRNQKVIEEAPSPLLSPQTREKMGAQAVALAKAVGYDSAGTVEFVADQAQNFYFLEMNTRLQVEHPVTELVTGIDLVEQMIRIAAGEPLHHTQADIHLNGWAVESRIYAEDPARNFMPSTGRLTRYLPPLEQAPAADEQGITTRVDAGVVEGGEISIHYDPMIAKLITHAPTRTQAIAAQAQALDQFVIEGIRPNITFLAGLMRHPRWITGALSTSFLNDEYAAGFGTQAPDETYGFRFAAVACAIDHSLNMRKRQISGQMREASSVRFSRERIVMLGEVAWKILIEETRGADLLLHITAPNGEIQRIHTDTDWTPSQTLWRGYAGSADLMCFSVHMIPNGVRLTHAGFQVEARVYTPREAQLAALMLEKNEVGADQFLRCPMPGLIKSVIVKVGQEVKTGDPLCIIEAMKMENILRAEQDGVVAKIHIEEGQSLAVDAIILEFASA